MGPWFRDRRGSRYDHIVLLARLPLARVNSDRCLPFVVLNTNNAKADFKADFPPDFRNLPH